MTRVSLFRFVPRLMKRARTPDYSSRRVFGVPLSIIQQRHGQPLPQCVLYAMRRLRRSATDSESIGVFRKSGVRSRILALRNEIEADPGWYISSHHHLTIVIDVQMCQYISGWRGWNCVDCLSTMRMLYLDPFNNITKERSQTLFLYYFGFVSMLLNVSIVVAICKSSYLHSRAA